MSKNDWEQILEAVACQSNAECGGGCIGWADIFLRSGRDLDLEDLFAEYLGTGNYDNIPVTIKVKQGVILIERK